MILITVIVISGCVQQKEKYTGPVEKVTIGVGVAPLSLPIWVAENKGYFADNGLDVKRISIW